MSDDLVTLARAYKDTIGTHWKGCERTHRECLLVKMADEIERLQKLVSNHAWQENEQCKRAERAEAERDALRALLAEALERVDTIDYCSEEDGERQFWAQVEDALREKP